MTPEQQSQVDSAMRAAQTAFNRLGKNGAGSKADGEEMQYAMAWKKVSDLRHQFGDIGYMGIRRDKYRTGLQ